MKECIFCKIVKKEIPAEIIYENNDFLAFLDVNPVNPGHTLIIPKKHARWVWDVKNFGEYLEFAGKIAKTLQKAMKTEWIAMGVDGNEVAHAHIHLVPRFENDEHGGFVKPDKIKQISKSEMQAILKKIKNLL